MEGLLSACKSEKAVKMEIDLWPNKENEGLVENTTNIQEIRIVCLSPIRQSDFH